MHSRRSNRDTALRLVISIIFAVLILLPLIFITRDLKNLADIEYRHQLKVLQQSLREELDHFKESLIPRLFVENLAKAGETHLGLTSQTHQRQVFSQNVDPQLFTANSLNELREFYRNQHQIEPLVVITFAVDCSRVWSWFHPITGFNSEQQKRFADSLTLFVADCDTIAPVMTSNPDALANFDRLFKIAAGKYGKIAWANQNLFCEMLSDVSYVPANQGSCYEMVTDRFNSRSIFTYHRVIKDGNRVYGGYFVAFPGSQITAEKMLAKSRFSRNSLLKRTFPAGMLTAPDVIKIDGNLLYIVSRIPVEFVGYSSLASDLEVLPKFMAVSADLKPIMGKRLRTLRYCDFIVRLTFLATFAVMIWFVLFGFPALFRLRARMLTTLALVMFLPYTILGYFCLSILGSVTDLKQHELRSEANGLMYRLQSYYTDQKLQMMLNFLKSKQRLLEIVDEEPETVMQISPHRIVAADSMIDFSFYRDDGVARGFRAQNYQNTHISQPELFLSVKYLNHLGALQKTDPKVNALLERAMLADGIMDSVGRNTVDHFTLINEAVETIDLKKVDVFSRMFYFLIPSLKKPGNPIRALVTTSVSSANSMRIRPFAFSPDVFYHSSEVGNHQFAIGQRRLDDTLLRWWPDYLSPDSRICRLLFAAVSRRTGGFDLKNNNGSLLYEQFRFTNAEQVVFAGISTASPELWLSLLILVFPFLLLIIALCSLFLSGDILSVLFISPVKGFHDAARHVASGNYAVAVAISKTDEFALLADSFNRMALGLAQREKMRRFVSENLYEQIGKNAADQSPEISQVTLLASDIRGFTTLSEKHEPQQIVSLLNDYFTAMETVITTCGGFVERLVGDAVVAVFDRRCAGGAEACAARAALMMRQQLAELNRQRVEAGLFTIENGIGIATGSAFSGMAGAESGRRIFSVIGGVTRLAEKLEAATRLVESRILLCHSTAAAIKDVFVVRNADNACGFAAFELVKEEVKHG